MQISLFNIRSVVPSLSDPFTVERAPSGTYDDNGLWQEQPAETFEACGSIQTMTDEDLQKLPEGRRLRGGIKIYTTSELLTANVDEKRQPDVVLWDGARWQVEKIDDWNHYAGYYKVLAVRMGQ